MTDLSISLSDGVREGWVASADTDGTPWIEPTPQACLDAPFGPITNSVASFPALEAAMVGMWAGCVTTPWEPPYWVTITFRSDGTYSGASQAHQLGNWQPAFYYGMDEDSPAKTYAMNDLRDDGRGAGQIDIVFATGAIGRGDLRNILVGGNDLEFEFFHHGQYGPLVYRLQRLERPA